MGDLHPEDYKRLRGTVLQLLCSRHNMQQERLDDIALAHALRSLAVDVGLNDVITVLQDLSDRSYVRYQQKRDRLTSRISLFRLECTSAGRDLVEETKSDPAVRF